MNVCVIGGAGFIGSHLIESLLADTGHTVIAIDRETRKLEHLLGDRRLLFRRGDISELPELSSIVGVADVVVHLAALCNPALYNTDPLTVIDATYTHALPVVRMARDMGKRLVFYSTCEVYGKSLAGFLPARNTYRRNPKSYLLSEDSSQYILGPLHKQRWTYACAKQMLERVIHAESEVNDLAYTIIRPFNFLGPRMDFLPGFDGEGVPRVFPCYMKALLCGEPLSLVDGGGARRAFTAISDAVEATIRVIDRPEASRGQTFNIGNPDNETSIAGLAEMMIDLYREKTGECSSRAVPVTSQDFYGEGYDDSDRRVPDIAKAGRLLDWRPEVPLKQLVSDTMDYYIRAYGEGRARECAQLTYQS